MKHGIPKKAVNHVVEKFLDRVVQKWYILSIWRLYQLLINVKHEEFHWAYGRLFFEYLKEYKYIQDILLSDAFLSCFEELIGMEVFTTKRHIWKISLDDTIKARWLLVWNLKDENCIIYKLMETQRIDV
jgi:hypothetical protein